MKKKKTVVKVIAILLALLMAASVFFTVLSIVASNSSAAGDDMNDLQRQALEMEKKEKELAEQKAAIEQKKAEVKGSLDSLNAQISGIIQKKTLIDENILLTQQEIVNISEQIAVLNDGIEIKRIEYEDALAKEDEQMTLFKERLREMEESGEISYYEILFQASSFGDLLSKLDMIDEVMKRDEAVISRIEQARSMVIIAQQELYDKKKDCESKQDELQEAIDKLAREREEADAQMKELEENVSAFTAAYEENAAMEAEIEEQLRQTMAQAAAIDDKIARLKREQNLENAGVNATGTYLWPSASSYYVTSLYGNRLHPILGYYIMHNGIDIGASYDTAIYAADGGIVVTSEYNGSYGNYVMIYHGDDRYTLYAHMSQRYVSVNDVVSQGEVIGLVGDTGYATGPHIHFEIYENGTRVDPLNYFTNYVLYNC